MFFSANDFDILNYKIIRKYCVVVENEKKITFALNVCQPYPKKIKVNHLIIK